MTTRPAAILTEAEVISIINQLKAKVPHRIIAQQFHVSKKTISRINTGETWKEISTRCGLQQSPANAAKAIDIVALSAEYCDLHDKVTAIKNHFGLSFNQPIYWGWFESWDGLHSLVSDGYIIWESADLVTYAQNIAGTKVKGTPVWAEKLEELPTFELERFMTQPIGERYRVDGNAGNIVRLVSATRVVFLRQKYVALANKMKLELREAGDSDGFVYLTRNKPKSKRDPMPIIIACASTMKEDSDGSY